MSTQNILILGSGGREHAMAAHIFKSPLCNQLFIAPGNPGTALCGTNIAIPPGYDPNKIAEIIKRHEINLVIIGPEDPLANGLVDQLQIIFPHVHFFGPSQQAAQLESSKSYAKEFMTKAGIPTAAFREFNIVEKENCIQYLKEINYPTVIKADGLAAGKGVIIANNAAEAEAYAKEIFEGKFGAAGNKILIEQFLKGREFSVFILINGNQYIELPIAKDYKKVFAGDQGPNTGGMGAVSPVPFVTDELMQKVRIRIIQPTVDQLVAENIAYTGFIFFGLIEVEGEPYVIEYNARFGDPEAEVIFPRITGDLVKIINALMDGQQCLQPEIDPRYATGIYVVAAGYPEQYPKNTMIDISNIPPENYIFQGGTRLDENGHLKSNGGRVIFIGALNENLEAAKLQALAGADALDYKDKYYRRDIAYDVY